MLWLRKGLNQPVKTLTVKKSSASTLPGLSSGRPAPTASKNAPLATICPTHALREQEGMMDVDYARCIHCRRCHQPSLKNQMAWEEGYHWAEIRSPSPRLPGAFRHSLHMRVVDAGDCGACLNELHQLASPVYSLHRLGIAFTPTPRDADVLVVTGPVTVSMKEALEEAYRAMPGPKRVMAVGSCALSGGMFASSFAVAGPVERVISVDIAVPGCPPPPLALLDGFRLLMGTASEGPVEGTVKP